MTRYLIALTLLFCASSSIPSYAKPARLQPIILDQKPHPEGAFTEGLIIDNDEITETSGLYGESYVVRYDSHNSRILQKMTLPRAYFAKGITQVGNKLYMLTWKAGKLFVLRAYSFEFVETKSYDGEGWGITYDGTHFVTSDGSSRLAFRDFATFEVNYTLGVHEGSKSWKQLKELEYAHGLIWANVWDNPHILAIDPTTGEVVGKADLSELVAANNHSPGNSVLNGIAYDKKTNAFWITGKLWPNRYLVHFVWHKPMVEPETAPAPSDAPQDSAAPQEFPSQAHDSTSGGMPNPPSASAVYYLNP